MKPPLAPAEALVEASRCHFCHDAPCIEACPTGIDIPSFIRKIGTGNVKGAAVTILDANIMGGICARVCPTEVLCEAACVRNHQDEKPVKIGRLQRHATDWLMERGVQPFRRAPETGRRVAVVGGGPAGLACAHRLALLGHAVTLFEAREKLSGLNEYGIAAYKTPEDFAQREVAFILGVGGIEVRTGMALGREIALDALRRDFDAVFLGIGLGATNPLGVAGDALPGVEDAVAWIEGLRRAADPATYPVGRRVVVIGGGNTAVDAAVQARRLGAEEVTLVYRRGEDAMGATGHERAFARLNDVRILLWARPVALVAEAGSLVAEFERTRHGAGGALMGTGERVRVAADQVLKAVGQALVANPLGPGARDILDLAEGRIAVNEDRETSIAGVFAGGDCIAGPDLTVQAIEDGKVAAHAIDRRLRATLAA